MWQLLKQYMWIADIIGILLCSYFTANLLGLYLEGKLEVTRSIAMFGDVEPETLEIPQVPREEYGIIVRRNIFDSSASTEEVSKEGSTEDFEEATVSGEAVKTSLPIQVLGVLVVGDGRDSRSTATIVSAGGQPDVYAVGDVDGFAPDTKLVLVQPNRIEFINKGRLEYAEIADELGESIFGKPSDMLATTEPMERPAEGSLIRAEEPGKYSIDQAEVDNALANLDKLYTEIRAVPNFSEGKVAGMKILSVKGGSIFSKLGLKRGDILMRINGIDLDVKQGFQIFSQLKDQKNFTLDLVRRGQPTTIEYEIR